MDLVLDRAVLDPARLGRAQELNALGDRRRHRLLGIDVLAGGNCLGERRGALLGCGGVEKNRKRRIAERGVEIGRPVLDAVRLGNAGELFGVAPGQHQARHDAVGAHGKPAFVADRRQRIRQVLGRADAPGGAVEDDAENLLSHAAFCHCPLMGAI